MRTYVHKLLMLAACGLLVFGQSDSAQGRTEDAAAVSAPTLAWSEPLRLSNQPLTNPADGDVAVDENCDSNPDDLPIYQDFTENGIVSYQFNGTDAAKPICPSDSIFDSAGNQYLETYSTDPLTQSPVVSLESLDPVGQLRWATVVGSDQSLIRLSLGWDGKLYGLYDSDVISVSAQSGAQLNQHVLSAPSYADVIDTYPSGFALGSYGWVEYYSYSGAVVRDDSTDPALAATAGTPIFGADGLTFLPGCTADNRALVIASTPTQGEIWNWSEPTNASFGCDELQLAATPNGGVALGDNDQSTNIVYYGLSASGSLLWSAQPTAPSGSAIDQYVNAQPVADVNGNVLLPSEYEYSDPSCGSGTCAVSAFDIVDQNTGQAETAATDLSTDSANTYYAVAAGRVYAAAGRYDLASPSDTLNAFDAPGIGEDYGQSLAYTLPVPMIDSAQILAPANTDRLLTRRLRIVPVDNGVTIAKFEYGWEAPGQAGSAPTLGMQVCANEAGSCTVSFSATTPSERCWTLWVRADAANGAEGPWTKATDPAGSSAIQTPPPPVLIALGDSITSGHHRLSNHVGTTCNDAKYGYPEYVWSKLEAAVPPQWRSSRTYFNLAKSGFGTDEVLKGGRDACNKSFTGTATPIVQAKTILAGLGGTWVRVVVTAGIDDTNWGDVVSSVIEHSLAGTMPKSLYSSTSCSKDLSKWDFSKKGSKLPKQIEQNEESIIANLQRSSSRLSLRLYWLGYYNIAPKSNGHPPIPTVCGTPMGKDVSLINLYLSAGAKAAGANWQTLQVMSQQPQLLQSWLASDVATPLGITLPGWPHPNTAGARAIAQLINVVS